MSTKGLIRSQNRRGAAAGKARPVEASAGRPADPTLCQHCGAVYHARTWRTDRRLSAALLARARWRTCPACRQAEAELWWGRVRLRGGFVRANEEAIRKRITNVAARAAATQPERKVVSVERDRQGLEVLTTSQKLAHRIVHELRKAFRGKATYAWSDDRSLEATWTREAAATR